MYQPEHQPDTGLQKHIDELRFSAESSQVKTGLALGVDAAMQRL